MPLPACYPTRLKFFTGIITDKVLFQKTVWRLRLEAVPPLCFHGVTLIFNSWELPAFCAKNANFPRDRNEAVTACIDVLRFDAYRHLVLSEPKSVMRRCRTYGARRLI